MDIHFFFKHVKYLILSQIYNITYFERLKEIYTYVLHNVQNFMYNTHFIFYIIHV